MDIPITLKAEEINMILNVLGTLPINSGAYLVMIKLEQQAREYVAANQPQEQTDD